MRAIETKYHGPTNFKGSKISAYDGEKRIFISYDHTYDGDGNHAAAAREFCRRMNWSGTLHGGHTKAGMVFVFEDAQLTIKIAKARCHVHS